MTLNPFRGERIGNLRERVALQSRTETPDDAGEPIISYVAIADVWARVEPATGKESFAAQQVVATFDYRVYVRYRDDLSVLDRIVWNGLALDVQAISNPDERRRFLALDCKVINP